jgi:hypothetical protein
VWASPVEHALAIRAVPSEPERLEAASQVIRGTLLKIEGQYYVLLDSKAKELRLLVSKDTELTGQFRPGDHIEVFTSPVEHALAIKAAK